MTERKYGIEIEAFGVDRFELQNKLWQAGIIVHVEAYNHETRDHWKITSDGSISGENPFELVSPPLQGERGIEEIKKVCQVLAVLGAQVNKSCGFHDHHDAAGLTAQSVRSLIGMYIRFQGVLDELVAPSRRGDNNRFCRAVTPEVYYSAFQKDSVSAIADSCQPDRYYKLNLKAYIRHNTVEFRQHQGTVDAEKIVNWIRLTQAMVESAEKLNHAKLDLTNRPVRPDHDRWHFWAMLKKVLSVSEFEGLRAYYGRRRKELAAAA
ncbi:MAG: hypothetical protein HPY71_14315 [Firmicutes bacterium]|nr:hypothetical protein [Bacillota bacterium]